MKEAGASSATAIIELDREYDGWCFEITFRKVTPEEAAESQRDNKEKNLTQRTHNETYV